MKSTQNDVKIVRENQIRFSGHFCTYVAQRHITQNMGRSGTIQILSEKQGCINVTDSSQVRKLFFLTELIEIPTVNHCKNMIKNKDRREYDNITDSKKRFGRV